MFERFTERARQVVVLAQEEARVHNHSNIARPHIVVGLLREEQGLAAHIMEANGITKEKVSYEGLLEVVNRKDIQVPFTVDAKRTMELALREALGLGHNYIGTEHILLALLRDQDDLCGVSATKLREDVLRSLSGPGTRSRVKEPTPPEPEAPADELGDAIKRAFDDAIVLGKALANVYELIRKR